MKDIINKLKESLISEKLNLKNRRVFLQITALEFKELFILNANIELVKRNRDIEFLIDEQNKNIINQLFFYATGNDKFNGDLQKGLMMVGNLGTGKTLIMLSFLKIIEQVSSKVITKFHAKEVNRKMKDKEGEPDFYKTRPLFIDDVGKEESIVNNFGTKTAPISDLFALRYDFGAWTFITTNHKGEELIEKYGGSTVDRFKEMFNILKLTGESRRK